MVQPLIGQRLIETCQRIMDFWKIFTGAWYGRYDKIVHFLASAAFTAVLLTMLPPLLSAATAFGGGLLKELHDWKIRRTKIEIVDLGADALGIMTAVGVYLVARWAVAVRLL